MKSLFCLFFLLILPLCAQEIADVDTAVPAFNAQVWLNSEPRSFFALEQERKLNLLPPPRALLPEEERLLAVELVFDFLLIWAPERPQSLAPSWSNSGSGFWQYNRPSRPSRSFREEQK